MIGIIRTGAALATLGLASANPIGLAVGAAGVVTFAMARTKTRPSDIVRKGEDGVVAIARGTKNKARSTTRAVKREYAARKIASAQKVLAKQEEQISKMTRAQLRALHADQRAIMQRVDELLAERTVRAPAKKSTKRVARRTKR